MTDKEKNQAVFTAMCELADKYLDMVKDNETMRKTTEQKPMLTYKDLTTSEKKWLRPLYERAMNEFFNDDIPVETVIVGNFRCTFMASDILDLMKHFGNANKYTFTLQQEEQRQLIAKFTMMFGKGAKRLADFTLPKSDMMHPAFQNVVVEYDIATTAVNVVGCDTHALAVITDDDDSLAPSENDKAVAMLPADDWKRICAASVKGKCTMDFTFFARGDDESFDTLVIKSGDTIVKSIQQDQTWPNWKAVLPSLDDMHYFRIVEKDRKEAQKWLSKLKTKSESTFVSVSVYDGSDRIYFDLCEEVADHYDYDKHEQVYRLERRSVSFGLTEVSDRTLGVAFDANMAKRFKPEGFWLQDPCKAAYVIDEDFDRLMVMPKLADVTTFDVEQREMAVSIA